MLKIWGRTNSINVQKVMWVVEELAIPHERVDAIGLGSVAITNSVLDPHPSVRNLSEDSDRHRRI